jgi:predicted PurR-regulated permease PerM
MLCFWHLSWRFLGDWTTGISFLIIWSLIVLFRRVAEPRFLGTQTGLHPVLSLLSIYVGMKAFGVLGMILAPTLLLVAISVCTSGVFDAFIADVVTAFQDISAFLKHKRKRQD